MEKLINYAVLGCGNIAKRVAEGINFSKYSRLYCFVSRSETKAREYQEKYKSDTYYTNYIDMLADEFVDVVYICTPNNNHLEHIKMCLNSNKHVICEKPMCKNIEELNEAYDLANKKNLMLMEAHKTCFTPLNRLLKQRIQENEFGKVLSITADYSINFFDYPIDMKDHWVCDKDFGGCSYDIGVYPLCFCNYIADAKIKNFTTETLRYVDFKCDFGFNSHIVYENGISAYANSSWLKKSRNKGCAIIECEKCNIEIPAYWKSREGIIRYPDKEERISVNMDSDFTGEIDEFSKCLLNKVTGNATMNYDTSYEILRVIEKVNEYRN